MTHCKEIGALIGTGLLLVIAAAFLMNPHPAVAGGKKETAGKPACLAPAEEKWGVKPLSVRSTAEGYMLDFRYRIIDAEKAAPLFSPKIKPYLVDETSGAVMAVPDVPKVGSMRSTRKPLNDRTYAILFVNPQKYIKLGNKVTVVIGDFRAEHLVVE